MIVDSSALIAILRQESDAQRFAVALASSERKRISAANFLETSIVVDSNRDPILSRRFDSLIEVARIEIAAVDEHQARLARAAYRDYGKGSGHSAGLNFGDCFAYALAKASGEKLLFKGDDFSQTDLERAIP